MRRGNLPLLRKRARERGEASLRARGGAEPGFLESHPILLLLSCDVSRAAQQERERGLDGGEQREEEEGRRRRRRRRGVFGWCCRCCRCRLTLLSSLLSALFFLPVLLVLFFSCSLLLTSEALAEEGYQRSGERRGLGFRDAEADRRRRRSRPFFRCRSSSSHFHLLLLRRLEGLARCPLDCRDELVAAGEGGGSLRHYFFVGVVASERWTNEDERPGVGFLGPFFAFAFKPPRLEMGKRRS